MTIQIEIVFEYLKYISKILNYVKKSKGVKNRLFLEGALNKKMTLSIR